MFSAVVEKQKFISNYEDRGMVETDIVYGKFYDVDKTKMSY